MKLKKSKDNYSFEDFDLDESQKEEYNVFSKLESYIKEKQVLKKSLVIEL